MAKSSRADKGQDCLTLKKRHFEEKRKNMPLIDKEKKKEQKTLLRWKEVHPQGNMTTLRRPKRGFAAPFSRYPKKPPLGFQGQRKNRMKEDKKPLVKAPLLKKGGQAAPRKKDNRW